MSLFSGISSLASYMGSFASRGPSRPFSLEPSPEPPVDAKHDFACSLEQPCLPIVECSTGDVRCGNGNHKEGSLHECEDWVLVPDEKQEEPCNCCAYVEGINIVCALKRVEPDSDDEHDAEPQPEHCLCCAFVEGVPSICMNRLNDSSDSDSE